MCVDLIALAYVVNRLCRARPPGRAFWDWGKQVDYRARANQRSERNPLIKGPNKKSVLESEKGVGLRPKVERLGLFPEKGEGRGKAKALNSAAQPGVSKSVLVNLGPIDPRIRLILAILRGFWKLVLESSSEVKDFVLEESKVDTRYPSRILEVSP
nr:uncharacterized protein LOC110011490 [Ipomoea trifida]